MTAVQTYPALQIDAFGRCPNCLCKPLVYKRDRKLFCPRCDREYGMLDGRQRENFAWARCGDGFRPVHPDVWKCHEVKPSHRTLVAARRVERKAGLLREML